MHNYNFFEVTYGAELEELTVKPPAIAYVREIGDFFYRHGPEYWFGRVGTPPDFSDREDDRWVRSQYSGARGLTRATSIEYLPAIARGMLAQLVFEGKRKFDRTQYDELARGSFYSVAEDLWYLVHNFQLVELNEQTIGTEGERLHDIADGDIVVESQGRVWCVQEKTKSLDSSLDAYGREVTLLGQRPLIEGTPGVHVQKAVESRPEIYSSHPERIGWIVNKNDIPVGAMSFSASILPDSLPHGLERGGSQWVEDNDRSIYAGEPSPGVTAPTDRGNWHLQKFAWLQTPDLTVSVPVSGFTPPSEGRMPQALNATLELEQGCPVPLISGGTVSGVNYDNWFIPPPSGKFGWMPRGTYGGGLNETSIPIQVRGSRHEYIDIGSDQVGPEVGDRKLNLYDSWINPIGKRRFSNLRGIQEGDLVSISNYNHLYRVAVVKNNQVTLTNPQEITLGSGLLRNVGGGFQNLDGIWLSNVQVYWVHTYLPTNPVVTFNGWTAPDDTRGIPLIIRSISQRTVSLMAPVAKLIPAGTRMPIWMSSDLDTVTYAYYDLHEFMFDLEQWVNYTENNIKEGIDEALEDLLEEGRELSEDLSLAREKAGGFWFTRPFYINRCLDDWLPRGWVNRYGVNTFAEVGLALAAKRAELTKLYGIEPPSWDSVEYMSLLRYSHTGIPGA